MKKKLGFTLVELLIVVGIIGILAVIAIPNFMAFQFKSKQAEAKANLPGIFAAEQSYFTEWGTYITDMEPIGWSPSGKIMYHYGWLSTDGQKPPAADMTNLGYVGAYGEAQDWTGGFVATANQKPEARAIATADFDASCAACTITAAANPVKGNDGNNVTVYTSFVVGAVSQLDSDSGADAASARRDVWTMTENRILTNTDDGTK